MSDMHGHQRPSDMVPHQDDVEELIDDVAGEAAEAAVTAEVAAQLPDAVEAVLEDASTQVAISDLSAPSAAYVEAEAIAMTGAINDILGVLRDAGLIPSS